jgi:hypothetical protein
MTTSDAHVFWSGIALPFTALFVENDPQARESTV